ncbi:MAG: MFS transporter [Nocardioidaceae bacterium]
MEQLDRDRLTWVGYLLLAWFAYLQAAPGLVVPYLRSELGFSYSVGGLHVAAFAAGSTLAGLSSVRLERSWGRGSVLWGACAVLAAGVLLLIVAPTVVGTIGSILVMGLGAGLLLTSIQSMLADHHGDLRGIALAEANVAASISYLVLAGALALSLALDAGWRTALGLSLVVPAVLWWTNRSLPVTGALPTHVDHGRMPPVFWVAAAMLMCAVAAEWCVTAWGATFAGEQVDVSPETATSLMAGYFSGVIVGRLVGSRLARRHEPARIFGLALGVALVGFAALWTSTAVLPAVAGLAILGVGIGNLFPMGLAVVVSLVPERAGAASARAVTFTSVAVLLAPLTVGTVADLASLRAAFCILPLMVVLAAGALALVRRAQGAASV